MDNKKEIDRSKLHGSRRWAAEHGELYFYTGRPCSKGHDDVRKTATGNCMSCERAYATAYKAKIREILRDARERLTKTTSA